MSSSLDNYLAELSDPSKPLAISKLANLSELTPEEIDSFDRSWPDIDVERRRQITGRLVELVEDNVELEFDAIFLSCLADSDVVVRARAVEGLGLTEERSAIEPLVDLLLKDEDYNVRAAAAGALGKFAMQAELGKLPQSDANKVEEALLAAFNSSAEHYTVRCRVLEAISPLERPFIDDMIRQAYRSDTFEFQVSAIYSMGRNCNPGWLPILLKELRSPNAQLRFEAARACGELEEEEAVSHLLELTHDNDAEVQMSAIEALGRIGGDEAREVLQEFLESPSESIREAAQDALDEIGFWDDPASL
jgi:HEAT repeat protein